MNGSKMKIKHIWRVIITFLKSTVVLLTKCAENIKRLTTLFTKRFASKGNSKKTERNKKGRENIWTAIVCGLSSILLLLGKGYDDISLFLFKGCNKRTTEIVVDTTAELVKKASTIEKIIKELSKDQNDTATLQPGDPQIFNQGSGSRKGRISSLKQAQNLTVTVGSWDEERKKWVGHGSGFLLGSYLCVTNVHVIAGHREIAVKPFDTQEWYPVSSRAKYDRDSHLVILKTEADLGKLSFYLSNPYNFAYKLGDPVTIVGNQRRKPYFLKGYISEPFEGKLLDAIQNGGFRVINLYLRSILDAWSDTHSKTGFIIKSSLTHMQSGVPIINNAFEVEGVVVADVSLLHFSPKSEERYKEMREALYKSKMLSDSQLQDKFFPDRHDFIVPVVHLYWLLAEKEQWVRLPIFIDSVFE